MGVETVELQDISGLQAIRLPDNFRIKDDKVYIKKAGEVLYIIPYHNPWKNFFTSLDQFTTDFMEDRNQPSEIQKRDTF